MSSVSPSVAVVLPAFNREASIDVAIASVIQQEGPFQLSVIVVDDASSDSTVARAQAIAESDCRVAVVSMSENRGAPYCRNVGVEQANGADYIAFQDSDDVWLPGKLARQLSVLGSGGYIASACRTCRVGSHSSEISPAAPGGAPHVTQADLLTQNYVSTQTLCVSRATAADHPFDTALGRFQDWELAIRIAGGGPIHLDRTIGVVSPLSDDSITRSANAGFEARLLMLKKHAELYDRAGPDRLKMVATAALVGSISDISPSARVAALSEVGCPPAFARLLTGSLAERLVRRSGRGVR